VCATGAVLVAFTALGCSDDPAGQSADRSTTGTATTTDAPGATERLADVESARAPVAKYLAAINGGDVDAAMAVRCPDRRLDDRDDRDLFAQQADRLVAATGELRIGELDLRGPVEQGASVLLTVDGFEGRIDLLVVEDSGSVLLCGFRPAASFDIEEGLPVAPQDAGSTAAPLADLFPASIGPGFTEVERGQVEPRDGSDFGDAVEVWTAAWQHLDYGGVRLEAARFADPAAAAAALSDLLAARAPDSVAQFRSTVTPQAIGLRILGFAWLWVQPPSSGPYNDLLGVQLGDTVLTVEPSGIDPATQQDLARQLLDQMVARAGVGG